MEQQNQATGVIAHLNNLSPLQLANDSKVQDKFIAMFNRIHGAKNGAMIYEAEKHHFSKLITENKDLQACTRLSLYGAFIDVAVQGLSFDPSRKLAYLLWDNHNVGTKDAPIWEKRARLAISPYGELALRIHYGQISGADNPEVVYEGEKFTKITGKDGTIVNHEITYPRPATKVIAAYVRLVKPNNTVDYYIMDLAMMDRLRAYSAKKNRGVPSILYGTKENNYTPDAGFWIAKCIKHAFAAYPKVKIQGQFSTLATDNLDPDPTDEPINYEITEEEKPEVNTASLETAQMTMTPEEKKPEPTEERPVGF